jgi:hypothetical protein
MARPLPTPEPHRSGVNGNHQGRPPGAAHLHSSLLEEAQGNFPGDLVLDSIAPPPGEAPGPDLVRELDHLRAENAQLRALCGELEQALQEATQHPSGSGWEEQAREYEALLEEKSEMIRRLHQQLQEAQAALQEADAQSSPAPAPRAHQGPVPREEELLALSEELERERRQLQEDEQSVMEQMREMEVGMAKERAELARQRNDLQRLQGEIRHELERLERNGALQSKIENLKTRLQDATTRRGAAPGGSGSGPSPATPPPGGTPRRDSFMGRLFGQGGSR